MSRFASTERRVRDLRRDMLVLVVATTVLVAGMILPGGGRILRVAAAAATQTQAQTKNQTVELSGDSVEYDVKAKLSRVTGRPGSPAVLKSDDMVLSGDRIEYDEASSLAVVFGNVRLERAEPDAVTLTAEEMTVDIAKDTAVAKRKVKMVRGKEEATAGQAVYDGKARQVLLTGEPAVRSEGNLLTGSEIIFSLSAEKLTVRGGSKVVVIRETATK